MSDNINRPHERIHALDLIRGVLIIGMILDHTLFDVVMIFELPYSVFDNPVRGILHTVGASMFILMSGMSAPISRNIIKRGLILAVFALAMTFFSWLGNHEFFIVFGILHFLSLSMLLYGFLGRYLKRVEAWTCFLILCLLYLASSAAIELCIVHGVYGGASWLLGVYGPDFASMDYYPVFPWIFIYLTGTLLSPAVFGKKLPSGFYELRCFRLELVGRYSLWIYLGHQAVIYGIVLLIKDLFFR